MNQSQTKLYSARTAWSEEDECYIATFPAWKAVTGHGDTPQEALCEAYDALEGSIAAMEELGKAIPEPDRIAEEIRRYVPFLNVSALARKAGINQNTLATKLRRGTRFSDSEAEKLNSALNL